MLQKHIISNLSMHYYRYPLEFFLKAQKELCFSQISFYGSVPHLWADHFEVENNNVVDLFQSYGFNVDEFFSRPYNYTLYEQKDSLLGKYSMNYYFKLIDFLSENRFSKLGVDLWGAVRNKEKQIQFDTCVFNTKKLCQYAAEKGIDILVGNISYQNSALMNTLSDVRSLLECVSEKNLYIGLEYGQMYLQNESIDEWFKAFGEKIRTLYISDARKGQFGYPLGTGVCPLASTLNYLQQKSFQGGIVLKMDRYLNEQNPVVTDQINRNYLIEKGWQL